MWPNTQETTDLVTFTEEILNGNFIFCKVSDPYSVRMRENTDQKDSEYRHFLRCAGTCRMSLVWSKRYPPH